MPQNRSKASRLALEKPRVRVDLVEKSVRLARSIHRVFSRPASSQIGIRLREGLSLLCCRLESDGQRKKRVVWLTCSGEKE
jgi:hypothetical protein